MWILHSGVITETSCLRQIKQLLYALQCFLHPEMLLLSGQPFTVNVVCNSNTPSGTLSSFAFIHNQTDHQLKLNKSINVLHLPSGTSEHETWAHPSWGPGSPRLSVQRLPLMTATLSLMSQRNWTCDSTFISQVKSLEAKWKGNVKGRAAFCLKCHCPFMSPQPSKWESGSGREGPSQLRSHQTRCWRRLKQTHVWCLHQ